MWCHLYSIFPLIHRHLFNISIFQVYQVHLHQTPYLPSSGPTWRKEKCTRKAMLRQIKPMKPMKLMKLVTVAKLVKFAGQKLLRRLMWALQNPQRRQMLVEPDASRKPLRSLAVQCSRIRLVQRCWYSKVTKIKNVLVLPGARPSRATLWSNGRSTCAAGTLFAPSPGDLSCCVVRRVLARVCLSTG